MTETASAARKHFFAASWRTLLPPLRLVLFAALPILLLRWTLYALLAAPLAPIIQRMGWVYRDKPMFLTAPGALFAAVVWTILLYFFLCTFRYLLRRRE
jgi:hypothetical protein